MRPIVSGVLMSVLAAAGAAGQQAVETTRFEVASVKPSPPPQPNARLYFGPSRGGPGTHDPGRITWENAALRDILMTAYEVQTFQINAPAWLAMERYDIVANVPAGATQEQVNLMWQNLLKERFGMMVHHETKQFEVDELSVAKGGSKLKPTDLGPNPDPFTPVGGPRRDPGGVPEMNGFGAIVMITPDGRATMYGKALTLADLASRFATQLRRPVIDRTGLAGRYDFVLDYIPDVTIPLTRAPGAPDPPPGLAAPGDTARAPLPDLAAAVEKQLGLKLGRAKAQLDVIVVDAAEKVPTEN